MADQYSDDGNDAIRDDFYAAYDSAERALYALKGFRDLLSEAGELKAVNREGMFVLLGLPIDALEDALGRMMHLVMAAGRSHGYASGVSTEDWARKLASRAKYGVQPPDDADPRDRELYEIFRRAKPIDASSRRRHEDRMNKRKRPNGAVRKPGNGDAAPA